MAKFSITLNTDNPSEISAVLAAISGNKPALVATPDDSDDDNGPVNIAAPALDSAGLPWDERIHAKSKTTKSDGTWKRGRGVTDEQAAAVESELRARSASPIPAQSAPFVPPAAPVQPPSNFQPQPPVQNPVVPPVNTPVPQPFPAAPNFTVPMQAPPAQIPQQPQGADFPTFMTKMQGAMQSGKITVTDLPNLVAEINHAWQTNMQAITDLGQPNFSHMIGWVIDNLKAKGIIVD